MRKLLLIMMAGVAGFALTSSALLEARNLAGVRKLTEPRAEHVERAARECSSARRIHLGETANRPTHERHELAERLGL